MKNSSNDQMTILGSGSIVKQLSAAGSMDEYHLVVVPVVLGRGRTMSAGVPDRLGLGLVQTRSFPSGRVLLAYAPAV